MRKSHFIVQVLIVALLVFCTGIVGASASGVTVFPGTAAVNVTQPNGQVVRMTGNFPIQPGAVMQANGGPVVVRGPGFTFTALKNTRFSLAKSEGKWLLHVYSGKVDYTLSPDAKVKFAHGNSVYDVQKIVPGKAGIVEGSVYVNGAKLAFADTAGELTVTDPVILGTSFTVPEIVGGAAIIGGAAAGLAVGLSSSSASVSSH